MNETTQTKITFSREESLGIIGTLKITKNLQQIIDRLHYKIGATEWSGILFYKLISGDIKDLKNLVFEADFLYPMNIGSSAYTEFDYNSEVINAYDVFESGIEQSTGLVHSHHSMATFFSGTDSTELKDNASQYNYYISLIVNFAHVYCAKIAFPSKTNVISEYWVKDDNGKLFKRKSTKEESIILIGDLNVIIEDDTIVPQWLDGRIEGLELKKKQTLVISSQPYVASDRFGGFNNDYGRKSNSYYDDFDWEPEVFKKEEKFSTNFSKAQEFLAALIYLDSTFKNNSIINGLKALESLKPEEMDTFESCLDTNFEIIHQNIYGSEVQMSKHTLQALTELVDYEDKFGLTQGYQIINEIVGSYAL